jgi:chromosome segregation ATPase
VPDSDDDIETRVTILEREVVQLRQQVALNISDAAAARVLAAGADHDVSEVRAELRAHTQALNALRETQLEQGRAIAGLEQKLAGLDQKLVGQDQKLVGQDQKLAGLEQKLAGLDQKLAGQDQKLAGLDQKVTEGFSMLGTGMAQITALLTQNAGSGPE